MSSPTRLEDRKRSIFCAPEFGGISVPVPIFVHPRDICNVGLIRQGGGLIVESPNTASICILLRDETDLAPHLTKNDDEDKILDLPFSSSSSTSNNRVVLSSAWIWQCISQGERVNHHPYIIRSRHTPHPLPSPSASISASIIGSTSTPASSVTHGETQNVSPSIVRLIPQQPQRPLQFWTVRPEKSESPKKSGSKRGISRDTHSDDEDDEDDDGVQGHRHQSVDYVTTKSGTKKARPSEHIPKDQRVAQMCDLIEEWDQDKSLDSFLKECSGRWGLRHWNSFWPMNKPAIIEHLQTRGIEMVRTDDKPPRWSKRSLEKE